MPPLRELLAVPPLTAAATDADPAGVAADWLVVPVEEGELAGPAAAIDTKLGGTLSRLRESGDLGDGVGETLAIRDAAGVAAKRLLFVGVGAVSDLGRPAWAKAVATACREVTTAKSGLTVETVAVAIPAGMPDGFGAAEAVATAVTEAVVSRVGPGLHQAESKRAAFPTLTVVVEKTSEAIDTAVSAGAAVGESVNLARGLVNAPADDVYPGSYAELCVAIAADSGLDCDVLDESRLEAERMGSLLAVARGSAKPPRVVKLSHRGGGDGPTLGLVGKGVTFDSGGLSLKPSDGMKDMKCDMAGSAAVVGAMAAIAKLGLPVNVCGYVGLVENMVSGDSYKLGDVLKTRQGTTVEVLNTDAEGRLVLADVLDYAVDDGVDRLVDLATLTGACVVALGEDVTGLFTNDGDWSGAVEDAAEATGELVWPMPMHAHFEKLLESDVADCKNVGPRWGGAVTAAKFLEKFVGETPWVHLDIAGPAFASGAKGHRDSGATGVMVRTLVELAANFGEG